MSKILHGEEKHHHRRPLPAKYIIAFFVLIVLLMGSLIVVWGFLFAHWTNVSARTISGLLPIPAAKVDDMIVSYHDVAELTQAAIWEEEDEPFTQSLETMVDRTIMKKLAKDIGTGISQEELAAYEVNETEVADLLKATDWTIEDYRKYVVEPLLLYQAVDREIKNAGEFQTAARARLQDIVDNINLGVSFSDLALQYSEHSSYTSGGDLGYLERDDFADGLEFIFDYDVDQVTGIVEWEDYFVVAKVYDVLEDESGRNAVGVRMIAIKKDDLSVVFDEYKKQQEIKIFLR